MEIDLHNWLSKQLDCYGLASLLKELLQNSDDAMSDAVAFVIDYVNGALWHF